MCRLEDSWHSWPVALDVMTWSVGVSQMGVVGGRNLLEDFEGWIDV